MIGVDPQDGYQTLCAWLHDGRTGGQDAASPLALAGSLSRAITQDQAGVGWRYG